MGQCSSQLLIPFKDIASTEGSCDLIDAIDVRIRGTCDHFLFFFFFTEEEDEDQGGAHGHDLVYNTAQIFPGQKYPGPALVM